MKKIIVYDTSIGSKNIGDQIINCSFDTEMDKLINNNFTIKMCTHLPVSHFYQNIRRNPLFKYSTECDYKFVVGTNIISHNMIRPWPNWNINIFNCGMCKNSILVGCGSSFSSKKINIYTKLIYKRVLSKEYIHSTRDEKTKKILESMGYKAINTGCITMWKFSKDFCRTIPTQKSDNVVFTLTDYNKDRINDQVLIDILNKNYKNVYFWVQGSSDLEYFNSLKNIENIKVINPSLKSYKEYLNSEKTDYVGTRLHAGIFAMQNHVRSLIIVIDNRARDIKDNYNINAIERVDISKKLEKYINSEFPTVININEKNIKEWKNQFEKI